MSNHRDHIRKLESERAIRRLQKLFISAFALVFVGATLRVIRPTRPALAPPLATPWANAVDIVGLASMVAGVLYAIALLVLMLLWMAEGDDA